MLRAHLHKPLTNVPDPFSNEYPSFGDHNNARLRRFLDTFGFDYEFASATEYYKSGRFDEVLLRAAERYDDIMKVMLPTLGPERQATYSPFLPISPKTGRVLYVPMKHVDAKAGTITFEDEDGTETTLSVTGGRVKMQWTRTIRPMRRSMTAFVKFWAGGRRNTSSTSCSSTISARRSPSPRAMASPSMNG
jgi:lysyl-tRNA synthetase class 1